jgi:hypothetical protein
VNNAIRRTIERTPPSSTPPVEAWARSRSRSPTRSPTKSRSSSVDPVMNPNPPTWTRARMTTWPNGLQWVAVSTTTRPVTHTADVAVKRAVTGSAGRPGAREIGSHSRSVPIPISARKPDTSTPAGVSGRRRSRRRTSTR